MHKHSLTDLHNSFQETNKINVIKEKAKFSTIQIRPPKKKKALISIWEFVQHYFRKVDNSALFLIMY